MLFQTFCVCVENRLTRVSFCSSQKEQESLSFLIPILYISFVMIFLWRNLNWNTLSFDSLVYRNDRQYTFVQFTVILELKSISLSSSHFPWLFDGIEGMVSLFITVDQPMLFVYLKKKIHDTSPLIRTCKLAVGREAATRHTDRD